MEIKDFYLWLSLVPGVGNKTIENIRNLDIDIKDLFYMKDDEILNIKNINTNIKQNIVKYKSISYIDTLKEKLKNTKVDYICIEDDDYPEKLRNIYNPPNILYYKGDISLLKENILAIVGSRKCSDYGIYYAKKFAKELSDEGFVIVSGLATGIDSYAHIGCLNGKSKTIAVLGSSANDVTPKKNINLYHKILDNNGLILSEYFVDKSVHPSNFVNRNRIISGISDGVLLVEAYKKSGSLITVNFGLEQGKNIFSVPANINYSSSEGCNNIIKQGAKLVTDISDILEEYNIIKKVEIKKYDLNEDEKIIVELVKNKGICNIDYICDNTCFNIKDITSITSRLVLKDILVEIGSKNYSLN